MSRSARNAKGRFQLVISTTLVVLLFTASKNSNAQVGIKPQPKATVTTDIRFVPMVGAEIGVLNHGGGGVLQNSAPVTCTFSLGTLAKTYTLVSCAWTGLDFNGQTGANAVGIAHSPGAVSVGCVATVSSTGGLSTISATSKTLFVVGGPISTYVGGGINGTQARDDSTDLNSNSPNYLEYFGFDPGGAAPNCVQPPQEGAASAFGGQPAGTTVTWTVPSPLEILPTGASLSAQKIFVGASRGDTGNFVQLQVRYSFSNPDTTDPVTGTCNDDTSNNLFPDGSPADKINLFDCHAPGTLQFVNNTDQHTIGDGVTTWGYNTVYNYVLKDDGFLPMNYVYVVERWDVEFNNKSGFIWPLGSSPTGEPIQDTFSDISTVQYPQELGIPYAGPFTHRYYAGTTDTSYYKGGVTLSGVPVLQLTTTYYTDNILNN